MGMRGGSCILPGAGVTTLLLFTLCGTKVSSAFLRSVEEGWGREESSSSSSSF